MKDEWRCARVDSGELCVMIYGDLQMLVWCAGSLATQDIVRLTHIQGSIPEASIDSSVLAIFINLNDNFTLRIVPIYLFCEKCMSGSSDIHRTTCQLWWVWLTPTG